MTTDLQALGKSFARTLKAEGKAERTRVLYGQSITFYARWLTAQGEPATTASLTRRLIRDWLADLTDGHAPATVKTRYRGLFRFCGWLAAEDELETNPMKGLSPPTIPSAPVPVLTDADLTSLLRACRGKEFNAVRDTAMLRLLLDCGLRVSELCGLTVAGTDLDNEYALVTGKGSKVRPVYFGAQTSAAVDKYLRRRASHRWAHLDALLITQRGAMSPDGVRERLKVIAAAAGVEGLHPHRFRHTFAHDFLMAGGQERDLKRLAGWTSDTMLERYGASAADARAKAAAQRMRRGDRV